MSPETPSPAQPTVDQQRAKAAAERIKQTEQESAADVNKLAVDLGNEAREVMAYQQPESIDTLEPSDQADLAEYVEQNDVQITPQEGALDSTEQIVSTLNEAERQEVASILNDEKSQIQTVTAGYEDLKYDESLAGTSVLGYVPEVGKGRGSVRLNPEAVQNMTRQEFVYLAEHELTHANDQKELQGDIIVSAGVQMDSFDMKEGQAERKGKQVAGSAARKGQPADYASAEQDANQLVTVVSTADYNKAMKTGDTGELQQKIWEKRMDTGQFGSTELEKAEAIAEESNQVGHKEKAQELVVDLMREHNRKEHARVEQAGRYATVV